MKGARNRNPAARQQTPLAVIDQAAMRACPMRSASRPAATEPAAPLAIVTNASADPCDDERINPDPRPRLVVAYAAIQVQTLYSSHMCPRYPSVASRVPRSAKTRSTADGSNRALFETCGPSPTNTATMTPPAIASRDAAIIRTRHETDADSAASRWGNADPMVSAPMRTPSAMPRRSSNHPAAIFIPGG